MSRLDYPAPHLRTSLKSFAASALLTAVLTHPQLGIAQAPGWAPSKPIEFIVGSGPGGSGDLTMRTVQKIFNDRKLMPVSSAVINKAGGGGSISWAMLSQRSGDAHVIALTFPNLLTNHIAGASPLRHADLTALAHLSSDWVVLIARSDFPMRNGTELLQKLAKEPGSFSIAFATARGNAPHIATGLALRASGVDVAKMRFVVFKSGGEVMPALLGGHVDLVATSPSVANAHMVAGAVKAIAVSSPQRLSGNFAKVPTWRELGANTVFANWRGIVGPKNLTPAQVAFWDDAFSKLVQTDEWKADVDRNLWTTTYLNSTDTQKFLDDHYEELKPIMRDLGVSK
ncbi:MAG: tripartite tricarboxylate transporter substrate binding protein [Bryobacteraceae bacterium]|nr:tripartite tricarboxylate transporter substrate binding protein [Bryobacteraceae bacterium]